MRRTIVLLSTMALTLLVASGVALAVTKIGTNGPDSLRGTNGADNLLGKGANDVLYALGGRDNLLGGEAKDWVLGGNERRALGGDKNLVGGSGNAGVNGGSDTDTLLVVKRISTACLSLRITGVGRVDHGRVQDTVDLQQPRLLVQLVLDLEPLGISMRALNSSGASSPIGTSYQG